MRQQRVTATSRLKKPKYTWIRSLEKAGGARYQQIVQQVMVAVQDGVLKSGDRLPPQRELAKIIGVDLTTVTRAYNELRLAGFLDAQGASGSYIANTAELIGGEEQLIDLSMNIPPLMNTAQFTQWLQMGFAYVGDQSSNGLLMNYRVGAGSKLDREAAATWLQPALGDFDPSRVLICAGAQSAISALILAYSQLGDTIAVESLTYPGMLAAARVLQRQLVPIATDHEGMVVEDLERLCKKSPPTLLYLVPTIQNPTTVTMSLKRREQIYAVAARYGVAIIEDDPYWLLAADAPTPIAALEPQAPSAPVFYVSTLSKCMAPGLRTAYVVMPPGLSLEPLLDVFRATQLMTSQSAVSMATYFIRQGIAQEMLHAIQHELAQRQRLATSLLPTSEASHPHGLHLWLQIPATIDQYRLIQTAQEQGLGVTGSEAFCVTEPAVSAMRVSLGGAKDQQRLAEALGTLASILNDTNGFKKQPVIV